MTDQTTNQLSDQPTNQQITSNEPTGRSKEEATVYWQREIVNNSGNNIQTYFANLQASAANLVQSLSPILTSHWIIPWITPYTQGNFVTGLHSYATADQFQNDVEGFGYLEYEGRLERIYLVQLIEQYICQPSSLDQLGDFNSALVTLDQAIGNQMQDVSTIQTAVNNWKNQVYQDNHVNDVATSQGQDLATEQAGFDQAIELELNHPSISHGTISSNNRTQLFQVFHFDGNAILSNLQLVEKDVHNVQLIVSHFTDSNNNGNALFSNWLRRILCSAVSNIGPSDTYYQQTLSPLFSMLAAIDDQQKLGSSIGQYINYEQLGKDIESALHQSAMEEQQLSMHKAV